MPDVNQREAEFPPVIITLKSIEEVMIINKALHKESAVKERSISNEIFDTWAVKINIDDITKVLGYIYEATKEIIIGNIEY